MKDLWPGALLSRVDLVGQIFGGEKKIDTLADFYLIYILVPTYLISNPTYGSNSKRSCKNI